MGILVQQNLIYHHTDTDNGVTYYEANPDACYNLVRSGKVLDVIECNYGSAERELVQTLMLLGHARVADLVQAFSSRLSKTNGHSNGTHSDADEKITSQSQLHQALSRLIQAEIVEPVRPESFRKPTDIFHEIRDDVAKTAPGEKATKKKDQQTQETADRFRQYRDRSKLLKRQLDQDHGLTFKRRKIGNGVGDHHEGGRVVEVNVCNLTSPSSC